MDAQTSAAMAAPSGSAAAAAAAALAPAAAAALVKQHFPERGAAIDALAAELGRSRSVGGNACLVYGPPATGKTAVVRCAGGACRGPAVGLLRPPC